MEQRIAVLFFLISSFLLLHSQALSSKQALSPPFGLQDWTLMGDAYTTQNFIRIAEDRQSKVGALWSNNPSGLNNWEVEFQFRIDGVSKVGADGLAFWYTEQSQIMGNLFGNQKDFKGLGVLLDTYDNDFSGKHPYLSLVINDGTQEFVHSHGQKDDGMEKGGCQVFIRKLKEPTTIRITYSNGILEMGYDLETQGEFKSCVSGVQAKLPSTYFFGFTANTGQLADNHDIHSVKIRDIDSSSASSASASASTFQSQPPPDNNAFLQMSLQNHQSLLENFKDIKGALSAISTDVVRQKGSSGKPFECSSLSSSISSLSKDFDKLEREQRKKLDELNRVINNLKPSGKESSFSWISVFTFVLVILTFVLTIINMVIANQEKRKKYF